MSQLPSPNILAGGVVRRSTRLISRHQGLRGLGVARRRSHRYPGRTAATPPPRPIETELGQGERGARLHGRRREIVECATA